MTPDEIAERLREIADTIDPDLLHEAADLIEQQQDEIKHLRFARQALRDTVQRLTLAIERATRR